VVRDRQGRRVRLDQTGATASLVLRSFFAVVGGIVCKSFPSPVETASIGETFLEKSFDGGKICPEVVQRGLSSVLARDLDLSQVHFHKVFNSSVENFHRAFIVIRAPHEDVARKLLRRARSWKARLFRAA
jgi:hypothetical protein